MKYLLLLIGTFAIAFDTNAQCNGGTVSPSSRVVCEDSSYVFTVSGAQGNLQWQQNTVDPLSASDWSDIVGATNTTYNVTNVLQSTWLHVLSDTMSCVTQTSSVGVVHVAPPTLSVSFTNITPSTLTVAWEPYGVGQQTIAWAGYGSGTHTGANTPFTITGSLPNQCVCVMVSQTFTCPNTQFSQTLCTPISFELTGSELVCAGIGVSLQAYGLQASFSWSPAQSLSSTSGPTVDAQPTMNTTYTVTATVSTLLGQCSTQDTIVVNVLPCDVPTNVQALNVDSSKADLIWNGDECTIKYRVRVKNMSTGVTGLYFVNTPDTTKALTDLTANTLYKVQVRSQCSSTGTVLSPWSLPVYFTTSGLVNCIASTNLNATASSSTTAEVTWTPVAGSAGYRLRYKVNGTTTWTPIVINNGAASSQTISALQPNTTYDYQLRTKCSINPLVWSPFTAVQSFTTPLRLGEEEIAASLQLYPNPSSGTITFNANGLMGTLTVYDAVGKTIVEQNVSLAETTLTNLPSGLLVYKFQCANGESRIGRFVVAK